MASALIIALIVIFLGVVVGIVLIGLIIYKKIKSVVPEELQNKETLHNMIETGKELSKQAESTPKNASGITSFLVPQITKDFEDFNVNEFFTIVETNLKTVFNIIEEKNLELITPDLEPLREHLTQTINDLKNNNIIIRYDDVVFHAHALRNYEKSSGVATITVSSSLEYYYYYEKNGKCISNKDIKKQTRYLSKFVYIYDKDKANTKSNLIGLNCPNCGAPLKGFTKTVCEYCGTPTIELDLKSWKFISYKED